MDQSQPPQRASHQKLQEGIATPHEHDVLSGRGNFVNYHAGNEHFRGLVRKHKVAYVACPKPQKGQFSRVIYNEIKEMDPPGRFLKQDAKTKLWYEIPEKQALAKTRQALREGAPELLKELTHDGSDDQDDEDDYGTHGDNVPGDGMYPPNPGYVLPPLVTPYGTSNSPPVMSLKSHHSSQNHSPPPPLGSPQLANPQLSRSPPMNSQLTKSQNSNPQMMNPQLGNPQLSLPHLSHHQIAMQNATKMSSGLQQIPTSQPISMRAAVAQTHGSTMAQSHPSPAAQSHSAAVHPSQVVSDSNFMNLQSRLAALYHGSNDSSFEPTPIDPNLHRNQQQKYEQIMDRHAISHKAERDYSPPQRDLQQQQHVNGRSAVYPRERTIHRDESLRIEKLFTQAANEAAAATREKSGRRMMGSSEHLSAMSFSIGDLTADTESNLSAVFEDSLRISDDHPINAPARERVESHKTTGMHMSHNMDMSFATIGDRNESTSHFVMSTNTFESFTGVFDDPDKKE